jgi:hypothetical protein
LEKRREQGRKKIGGEGQFQTNSLDDRFWCYVDGMGLKKEERRKNMRYIKTL